MILGTILISAALVASTATVQQMQMERAMHAHLMEEEKRRAEAFNEEKLRFQEMERQRIAEQEIELLRQQSRLINPNFNPDFNPNPLDHKDYPFAKNVPDKPGFVISPHGKHVVDVRDIPPGTLVQDPHFARDQKKFFRVPRPELNKAEKLKAAEMQRIRNKEQEAELHQQNAELLQLNEKGPPFASQVPGKIGFVFSPYTKQVVDVRGIASGTLIEDPTLAGQKMMFRVP